MPKKDATRSMSLTSQESYSAVIIADMVAEVRSDPDLDPKQPEPTKQHTNPAFDPYLYTSPAAVVAVEMVEATVHGKSNGGIGKGVILNATQFGQPDKLVPDPVKMEHKASEVKVGMSVARKIAFAMSFLPSVMFVLCFAVILPCKEPVPCIKEMWANLLVDVALTSDPVLSGPNIFYTSYSSSGKSIVSGISQASGTIAWTASLKSPASFLQCAKLENSEAESCMVVEDSGRLHLYNASNGHMQWDKDYFGPTTPAVVSDCNGDGVAEVALGVTEGQVKVLMNGALLVTVNVTGCESVPSNLTPWHRGNGTTDLLFICRHRNEEKWMKLPQSRWCLSSKKSSRSKEDIVTFESREIGVLEKSTLLPTEDGVVLWVEDDVIMFDADGQQQWTVSSTPHSTDNRFLLHGKFNETDTQVALFSGTLKNSLRVSTLSFLNGEEAWYKTESNSEISDVSLIHGKEKDFAVVALRKAKGSLANEALDTIGAVSSTIMSVLTKEDIAANESLSSSSRVTEEIAFLEFGSKFLLPIEDNEVSHVEGGLYRSTLTVIPSKEKDAETLPMIISRNPMHISKGVTSRLRRIDVANWDISLSKESQCKWRQ